MSAHFRLVAVATLLSIAAANIAAASGKCPEVSEPRLAHPTDLAAGAGFGIMLHPLLNVDRLHAGLDYPGPTSSPIRAAATGTVEFAAYDGQHGNRVIVRHSTALRTTYSHLRWFDVTAGQCVEAGSIIEPHLHFEVHAWGGPVDPAGYLPPR